MIELGDGTAKLTGFAALGSDRRSAIEPLVELWGGAYFDDGVRISAVPDAAAVPVIAAREHMGCSADGEQGQPIAERRQEPADALPTVLTIDYYDPERDFQAGQMRASMAAGGRSQRRIDSAAALSAAAAKSLVSDALARRWAGRDRLTLRLSPAYLDLRPGQRVSLPPIPGLYRIEEVAIDGLVVIADARRTHLPGGVLAADPGRGNVDPDLAIGASVPLLLDLPWLPVGTADGLGVGLALGCTGAFKPTPVEILANGQPLATLTMTRAATTGRALTVLGGGQAQLIDRVSRVEVQCDNPAALLFNADEEGLAMGANAAMVGRELIQFARADALGGGHYCLSGLLRGRQGSEWAMAEHVADEPFVLLDPHSLTRVAMDRAMLGATVEARAYGVGDDESNAPLASLVAGGESLRPLSPCQLRGTIGAAGLALSWLPRRVEAFAWISADDPDTSGARYRVSIDRGGPPIVRDVGAAELSLSGAEYDALGGGAANVLVVELGPGGASRAASFSLAA